MLARVIQSRVALAAVPAQRGVLSLIARRSLSTLPPHSFLTMPALSPTMTSGNIAAWKKGPGDAIAADDVIADIETDKATVDFTAVDDGFLAKILIPEGCAAPFAGRATFFILSLRQRV